MKPVFRITALALLVFGLSACDLFGPKTFRFDEQQIQNHIAKQFPRHWDARIITLSLDQPRVRLPKGHDRLVLDLNVTADGLGMHNQPLGHVVLESGVRFSHPQQAVFLDEPSLLDIQVSGLPDSLTGTLRGALNKAITAYASNEPIYVVNRQLLAALPKNRQIGATYLEDGKLVVELAKK